MLKKVDESCFVKENVPYEPEKTKTNTEYYSWSDLLNSKVILLKYRNILSFFKDSNRGSGLNESYLKRKR